MRDIKETIALLRYGLRCKVARQGMFAVLGGAVICLVVALAWWGPALHEQAQLSRDIAARRAEMIEIARAEELSRAHRKALTAISLFENKLGVRTGQAELIQGVGRLASARGLHVVSQSFEEGRAQRGEGALYLELGLTGDYGSLRRLLGDLSTLPMWLEVVEARIERAGEGGGQVRAQLRLLTYRTPGTGGRP